MKIKKYFYVLRPILACEWIEKYHTMPPIEFDDLVHAIIPEGSELNEVIQELLIRKKSGEELDYEPRIMPINAYVEERLAYYEKTAGSMPAAEEPQDERLDELFRAALLEVWQ